MQPHDNLLFIICRVFWEKGEIIDTICCCCWCAPERRRCAKATEGIVNVRLEGKGVVGEMKGGKGRNFTSWMDGIDHHYFASSGLRVSSLFA